MKWLFLLFLLLLVPALTAWLKANPRLAPICWMAIGLLPFLLDALNLYVAPISWPHWPGFIKGMEVSLLDALVLAVLMSCKRVRTPLSFKIAFGAYLAAVLLSVGLANVAQAALFHAWQICRIYLLFVAVFRLSQDDRAPAALISGMTLGLLVQVGYAIDYRLSGALQTGGSFGHQNLLGMASYFVTLPALALLMAGERSWAPIVGPLAGIATAILGASRATIGFMGAGLIAVVAISAMRGMTRTKGLVALVGVLVLVGATPLAVDSLERRFSAAPTSDYDERAAFEKAAWMMIDDHPFGVGANNFVIVANSGGYWDRAGVAATFGSRSAHVHNVYLLVAAETGYLGLAALIALMAVPIWVALRCAWKFKRDRRSDLLVGLAVALILTCVHSFYEWIFITFQMQYLFAIALGLVAGLAQKQGYWKRARRSTRMIGHHQTADAEVIGEVER